MNAVAAPPPRRTIPFRRTQTALAVALLALAAVGWLVTDRRMSGMDGGPGTDLGSLGFYVSAWVVMMAAMMFPSLIPMVLGYRRVARSRITHGSPSLFIVGYLIAWTAFGLLAYALFDGVKALSIDALRWSRDGGYVAGIVIVLAAAYQLAPAKDACLRRCRNPFEFLTQQWRPGRGGALRMGALHGAWCVGCCWGLMVALFAVGVMSVGWMAFVAVLIAGEKLLPWPRATSFVVAAVLLALGLGVALAPRDVPGLILPSSHAMSGMQSRMNG